MFFRSFAPPLIIFWLIPNSGAIAQSPYPQNTAGNHPIKQALEGRQPLVTTGDAGDETSAILDAILLEAINAEGVIIIISRLGYGEKQSLHARRLHNALTRMVCYWAPVARERVVAAVGDPIRGLGQIEFYWKGKLIYIAKQTRNRDFSVDCCGKDERYYPWYTGKARECSREK